MSKAAGAAHPAQMAIPTTSAQVRNSQVAKRWRVNKSRARVHASVCRKKTVWCDGTKRDDFDGFDLHEHLTPALSKDETSDRGRAFRTAWSIANQWFELNGQSLS